MIIFKSHELLSLIQPYISENPCIVEAGAFDGKDTKKMAAFWPHATIHAFEPVPMLYTILEANTILESHIKRYPMALSGTIGNQIFYISEKPTNPGMPSQAGSLLPPKERLHYSPIQFPYTIEVPTITLDAWAHNNNILAVDMLWLDLQGYELTVLQASDCILPTVRVIYTEVSFIESYQGQPQYPEIHAWIVSQGFTLIGTDFQEPHTWFFGNALFVRTTVIP